MSINEAITRQSEDQDISVFTPEDDLYSPESLVKEFNHSKISRNIDSKAYRAKMVVDAQAQIMLARYQAETPDQEISYQDKAEAIAYELGQAEFNGIDTPDNPFSDSALAGAWDNGYTQSARIGKPRNQLQLEQKFWEQGIDLDSDTSQFELAAITLFNMALRSKDPAVAERCKRLALEMASYSSQQRPSAKRQRQLNQFMALQSERIAQAIEMATIY